MRLQRRLAFGHFVFGYGDLNTHNISFVLRL
ncbi:hypothetical protein EcHS_A2782 [Escherichia coli HS]|nr:hypothetical protein EcHS_A2782 [Escherichia coli HS]